MTSAPKRPFAVEYYRDKISCWKLSQHGVETEAGYYRDRARYGTREAAERQANYHNQFDPVRPARVVDIRT